MEMLQTIYFVTENDAISLQNVKIIVVVLFIAFADWIVWEKSIIIFTFILIVYTSRISI